MEKSDKQHLEMLIENASAGDYRAAYLLESEIERRGLIMRYMFLLSKEVGVHPSSWDNRETLLVIPWLLLRATPAQRARAYLKAIA